MKHMPPIRLKEDALNEQSRFIYEGKIKLGGLDRSVEWHRQEFYEEIKEWFNCEGAILDPKPSQEIYNHSPDGFSWGYGGSGPSQLALALMLEAGANTTEIHLFMVNFLRDVVSKWDKALGWTVTLETLKAYLLVYRHRESVLSSHVQLICGNPHCEDGFFPRQSGPDPVDVDMEPCPICGGP